MPKYDIKRDNTTIASVAAGGNQNTAAMGVNEVSMSFTLVSPVVFQINDYCMVYGNKYVVYRKPEYKKISERQHEYSLYLVHEFYKLQNTLLKGVGSAATLTENQFTLTGNLSAFANLAIANANRNDSGWVLGAVDSTDTKTLQFSGENLLAAINRIAADFGTEYWIEGKTIHFTKRLENSGITLSYGEDNGLISLTKGNKDANATIFTRLFVEGSEKNLPSYTNYGHKRLQLPAATGGYIDNPTAVAAFGVIEHYRQFDDIFPKHTGTVTSVNLDDETIFADTSLPFNVNDQLLPGVTATIIFQTGLLAGYEFDIHSFDNATKTFEFIAKEEPAIEGGVLPTPVLKPAVGDTYIVFNIAMPTSHIQAAEAELLARAEELLAQGSDIDFNDSFTAECDPLFFKRNTITPVLGQYARLFETNPAIDVTKRMSAISRDLQNPWKYDITFTDKIEVNAIVREYIKEIEETNIINEVRENVIVNKEAVRRAVQRVLSLRDNIFDPDGYFKDGNIKAETIEAIMFSSGYQSGAFSLEGVAFMFNEGGNPNAFNFSSGKLLHWLYEVEGLGFTWNMYAKTGTLADSAKGYYLYAKVSNTALTGTWEISENQYLYDWESGFRWLLVGRIFPVVNGRRELESTHGVTSIIGNRIRAGTISDFSGNNYWNLETGEMKVTGSITVVGNDSNVYTKDEVDDGLNSKTTNYLSQPTRYVQGDTWTLQADLLLNGIQYREGDLLTASESSNTFNPAHWSKQVRYTSEIITLTGATQIITVSKTGVNTPASAFTVVGTAQNTTIDAWEYSVNGAVFTSTAPAGVSRAGNTVTIDPTAVTFRTLTIRATNGTQQDTFTVARAFDGADGTDGQGIAIKGSVATHAALPSSGLTAGDAYLVEADGKLYIWDGAQFPASGSGIEFKGDPGADGQDGYTILLTNENHTFPGSETAALGGTTTCEVIAYKGDDPIAHTISVGTLPTGLTSSVAGSTITFTSTTALTTAGTVDITITAGGKSFVRKFSFAISFKGVKGETGEDGKSVVSVDEEFAKSDSATVAPTTGWQTTAPTWEAGKYIWSRTKTTFSDATTSTTAAVNRTGAPGIDGREIASIEEQYYLSTSNTTQSGGSWSTTPPTWTAGTYIWTRLYMTFADGGDPKTTTPVLSILTDIKQEVAGKVNVFYAAPGNLPTSYKQNDILIPIYSFTSGISFIGGAMYRSAANRNGMFAGTDWWALSSKDAQDALAAAAAATKTYIDISTVTSYKPGDRVYQTVNDTRGGASFLAGKFYVATATSSSFNAAHWRLDEATGAKVFRGISPLPANYNVGDIFIPDDNFYNAQQFIANASYVATVAAASFVGWHWQAVTSASAEEAKVIANSKPSTFTTLPTSGGYKAGDLITLFVDASHSGRLFRSDRVYKATTTSATFNIDHWVELSEVVSNEQMQAGSLSPVLKEWNIKSQTLVSISNAPEGVVVLRMDNATQPNAGRVFAVNPAQKIKTRFWARRSADNNGLLYFTLRQFKDRGITPCDTNSGRSPYYPAGISLTTTWTLYERIWQGADWQSQVAFVQPEFLGNYGGTSGHIEINGFSVYEVSENAQYDSIKQVLRDDGQDIGALSLRGIFAARDNTSQVKAYMSGYGNTLLSSYNPIAFAAGVSNFGLVNESQQVAIYHNGNIIIRNATEDVLKFLANTGLLEIKGTVKADAGYFGGFEIINDEITGDTSGASESYVKLNPTSGLSFDYNSTIFNRGLHVKVGNTGVFTGIGITGGAYPGYTGPVAGLELDIDPSQRSTLSRAIDSKGGHHLQQRSGEYWNAPGVLMSLIYRFKTSYVQLIDSWAISGLTHSGTVVNQSTQLIRVTHNLGHTDYVVMPQTSPGVVKSIVRSTSYFEVDFDNLSLDHLLTFIIVGRNN